MDVFVHMCMCIWRHVWRPEDNIQYHFSINSPIICLFVYLMTDGLLLAWTSLISHVSWSATPLQHLHPLPKHWGYRWIPLYLLFMRALGVKLVSSRLHGKQFRD